jgi:hypothetical protein
MARGIITFVSGRMRCLFVAMLLTVCVGAPIVEMFDRWDHTLQDGNDTESNLVVVVLCVGIGLLTAGVVLRRVRPLLTFSSVHRAASLLIQHAKIALILPIPYTSLPVPLRV